MRNLSIVRKIVIKPPCESPSNVCIGDLSSCIAIDGQTGPKRLIRINPQQQEQKSVEEVHLFTEEELQVLHPLDQAVQTAYVPLLETLYIASFTGGFYQLNLVTKVLEEIFISPSGISHFEISPDSRVLAVATKEETVTLFSVPDFELLSTIEVGPQRPEGADEGLFGATIRWRWDSRYFAVNFYNGVSRRIKFYDDTGKLYAESEETCNIASKCLAWQPSGGLIGTLCKTPSGTTVVTFFELNGLKRSDFNPYEGRAVDEEPVLDLLWNSSSDVLALKKRSCVELWHRSNYFWMHKKTISIEVAAKETPVQIESLNLSFIAWDTEVPYRFHVLTNDGSYALYEFLFEYSQGLANGSALVASVNGNSLYSTPFRDTCAPPPKCMFQTTANGTVQEVIVSHFYDGLLCIQGDGNLQFFKNSGKGIESVRICSVDLPEVNFKSCYSWTWPNKSQVSFISNGDLLVFELPSELLEESSEAIKEEEPAKISAVLKVRGKIATPIFKKNSETKHLLVQKRCGAILLQELCVMPNILLGRLPPTVHQLKSFVSSHDDITESSVIVFGFDPLTRQLHALYKNRASKIMNDCTSFDVFEDWLLVTTLQGSLEIIRMADLIPALTGESVTNPETICKYSRKIEKGSVIVTACWNRIFEPSLTLQILPRGNLETVSPRPLMISSIAILLKNRKYNEVMIAMRRHRLDFNVLATQLKHLANEETTTTERPAKDLLVAHLTSLLEDVKDSHTVVLMVTELGLEHSDCVKYMKEILEVKVAKENVTNEKLVNPYLAVMAKLQLFEEVLLSPLIALNGSNRELAKSRIKFLGFYCENPDILYDSALGSYDLTLTSLVADCLNKDPKEYLPTLNDYQKLAKTKLQYTIDHKLRRYNRAIVSLIQLDDVSTNEVVSYTERYKIHEVTIKYLQDQLKDTDSSKYQHILEELYCSYAKVFLEQQNFSEAAVCFYRGKDFDTCVDAYGKAGQWGAAVRIAQSVGTQSLDSLFKKLVKYLEDRKDYNGAGEIYEHHLKDHTEAFRSYIKGRNWDQAGRLAHSLSLLNEFKNELESTALSLQELCSSIRHEINKYVLRLRVVKELKEKALAAEGNFDGGDNFSDTESVSTAASVRSGGSSATGKTFRSGKNTRKLKRKVYTLKEGSRFEDLAIIAYLWENIQRVQNDVKAQVEAIAPCLWQEAADALAISLISTFEQLLGQADECVKEVWPSVLTADELLEPKFCVSPPGWSATWKKCSLVSRNVLHRR